MKKQLNKFYLVNDIKMNAKELFKLVKNPLENNKKN